DKIADEYPGNGTVGHAVARVASRDVDVPVSGVAAYKGHHIHRFHYLTRPPVDDFFHRREMLAGPPFESRIAFTFVEVFTVGLSRFMIFSAGDEQIMMLIVRLEPDIMIGVGYPLGAHITGIPPESWPQRVFLDEACDNIGSVGVLLGVYGKKIIDRCIRSHDHMLRFHGESSTTYLRFGNPFNVRLRSE